MVEQDKILNEVTQSEYKYGFVTDIDTDIIDKGLNEDVIRIIWAKKQEPDFMLDFRLEAYRKWTKMKMPNWAYLKVPPIDFQAISYYAAPRKKPQYESLDEVDPELLETFNKLGIPLEEQKHLAGVAVDAVLDSVSVKTTFKEVLAEQGIIFCSFSDAVREHP
ncbi:MAG: Fe-S cluster assembly protein SufB, partial [Prolixibacteraceae bacterium]|nr:Fe-S cluster assembly protein SufB [Prolixibacteraceae bacterium]